MGLATMPPRRRFLPAVSKPYPVLALVASAHGVTHMYSALLPLVYPFMLTEFGMSYTELGLVVGISGVLGGLLQLAFGILGKHVPHKLLIGAGNMFAGITIALFGAVGNAFQFGVVRALQSAAQSPQHPIGSSMLTSRFGERLRASALSIHVAGGNLGTLLVPVVGTFLIAQMGWRPTMLVFALPGLLVGAAVVATITESGPDRQAAGWNRSLANDVRAIGTNRTLLLILASSMVAAGGRGMGVLLTYVPLYLTNALRFSSFTVGILFTALLAGSIVGPILGGRLSDSVGRKRSILIALTGSLCFTVLLVLSGAVLGAVAGALALMGLCIYSQGPIMQTYLADVAPPDSREAAFGMYFAATFLTGAVYSAAMGFLIDHFGFAVAFLTMALSYAATFAILLPARECRQPSH